MFFSKSPFVKDDLDFDVFCVDPDDYATLYKDAFKDRCLHWLLYCSITLAFCILIYSCSGFLFQSPLGTSDDNIKKRQIMNAYHRYMNRGNVQEQAPIEEEEEEEEEEEPFSPPENATPVSTPSEEESTNETWGEWIVKGLWSLLGYSCIPLFQETEYNEKEFIV